jgi:hypothetical protein
MSTTEKPAPAVESPTDPRFNMGLIYDINQVLERHGYRRPEPGPGGDESPKNRAYGSLLSNLYRLVREYEGIGRDVD